MYTSFMTNNLLSFGPGCAYAVYLDTLYQPTFLKGLSIRDRIAIDQELPSFDGGCYLNNRFMVSTGSNQVYFSQRHQKALQKVRTSPFKSRITGANTTSQIIVLRFIDLGQHPLDRVRLPVSEMRLAVN